jgi:hypothetical protein
LFNCKHGNERFTTHDDLGKEIFLLAKSAGLSGKLEPLLDRSANSRRADIVLHKPDFRFCKGLKDIPSLSTTDDVFFDVKVGFPCADSYISKGSHRREAATCDDGFYHKLLKYPASLLQGRGFLPLSFETFGRFHSSIKPFLTALCSRASAISGIPHSVLVNYWTNRISASLQKNIAHMLLSRVDRIISSSDRFSSGSAGPIKTHLPTAVEVRHPRVAFTSPNHFRH